MKDRLNKFRSIVKLGKIEVSDSVKLLDGSYVDYEDYMESKEGNKTNEVEVPQTDLPF